MSRSKAATTSKATTSKATQPQKRFSEVFEVDAPEGTTLGQAFTRNAFLGASTEVVDELGEMVRAIPYWAYDTIIRPKKREKKTKD